MRLVRTTPRRPVPPRHRNGIPNGLRSAAAALLVVAAVMITPDTAWSALVPKTPPLNTPWTSQVSTTNPLPDYPRPQLTRPDWQSLNGQWQFAGTGSLSSPPFGQNLAETVLVPYPIE